MGHLAPFSDWPVRAKLAAGFLVAMLLPIAILAVMELRAAGGGISAPGLATVTAVAVVSVALTTGALARRILAPIEAIAATIRRFSRGDLAARVALRGDDLAGLGAAFNAMADDCQRARSELHAALIEHTLALQAANQVLREREASLVAAEKRFRDLYENSPDMYMTTDANTQLILDCNQTLCERLGYARSELLGKPFHTVYHPEVDQSVPSHPAALEAARGESAEFERVLRSKDGRRIDASLSLRAVRDSDNRIIETRAVWRDITIHKQAESDRQFLLGLSDVLRSSTEPTEVLLSVCTQLASYLGASRALFAEVDLARATAVIHRGYHGDLPSLAGVLPLSYFGRETTEDARRGATVVIADASRDPRTAAIYDTAYRPHAMRAVLLVPLLRDGAWATTLVVASSQPRAWQDHEIALAKLAAERAWGWVEHLRVLAELREQSVREAEQVTESRMLRARQGELARNLKEREVLLQEIHHRVKNNLQVISSLINMQVRKLEPGTSRDALEQCQTRVLAIALIHEKLYQSKDYSEVHFAEYARSLAASVFHALGVSQSDVTLELAIDDVPLGVDRAIPCGLLLNELITNALKHAFPAGRGGTVRVELARIAGGRLRLVVRDDGVGLSVGFDLQRTESLGMQLVTTLAEQLEATLEVSSAGGATFQLTFSLGT
jgi:PAS domain S-box-containing protein